MSPNPQLLVLLIQQGFPLLNPENFTKTTRFCAQLLKNAEVGVCLTPLLRHRGMVLLRNTAPTRFLPE